MYMYVSQNLPSLMRPLTWDYQDEYLGILNCFVCAHHLVLEPGIAQICKGSVRWQYLNIYMKREVFNVSQALPPSNHSVNYG
jgi:hypothetical protein